MSSPCAEVAEIFVRSVGLLVSVDVSRSVMVVYNRTLNQGCHSDVSELRYYSAHRVFNLRTDWRGL